MKPQLAVGLGARETTRSGAECNKREISQGLMRHGHGDVDLILLNHSICF